MNCEECSNAYSKLICTECDEALCIRCDEAIHRGGKRKTHTRLSICQTCRSAASEQCVQCQLSFCDYCKNTHTQHRLVSLSCPIKAAVFWDLNSCKPAKPEDISKIIANIRDIFPNIDTIKAYGEAFQKLKSLFTSIGVEFVVCEGLKETEALLIDISIIGNKGITDILILTSQASHLRPHLTQIQANFPAIKLVVSLNIHPITPIPVDKIPKESQKPPKPTSKPGSHLNRNSSSEINHFEKCESSIAVKQFFKKYGQDLVCETVINSLKELAENGMIMHDLS